MTDQSRGVSRRSVFRAAGVGAAVVGGGALLEACNLGGNPQKPTLKSKNTIMFFLGAEHLVLAFKPMWDRIGEKYGNNHSVAAAFPNDSDGNAFRAVFPAVLTPQGYKLDLSTAYPDGLTNYT